MELGDDLSDAPDQDSQEDEGQDGEADSSEEGEGEGEEPIPAEARRWTTPRKSHRGVRDRREHPHRDRRKTRSAEPSDDELETTATATGQRVPT